MEDVNLRNLRNLRKLRTWTEERTEDTKTFTRSRECLLNVH